MFGKKLLSIISVLFVGSQLVSLTRAQECTISYTSAVTNGAAASCTTTSCAKGFYKVFSATNNEGSTYTRSSDTYPIVVQVTGENACTDVTSDNSCASESDVGKYYATGNGVCIVGGVSPVTAIFADTPAVNYLILKDKATTFGATTAEATYDYAVLKSESNSIVFDSAYSSGDGIEDCYTTADGKIMKSIDNYCANVDCNKYYTCKSGECVESDETVCTRADGDKPKCVTAAGTGCEGYPTVGYYYYASAKAESGAAATTLYDCPGDGACTPVPRPIGYYVNADSSDDTDGYLKCSRSGTSGAYSYTCEVIAITANKSTCDSDVITAGGLYRNSDVFLCLSNSGTGIKLAPALATSYMVSVTSTGFLGVSLTDGFVILNVPATSGLATIQQYAAADSATGDRYKYADGTAGANNEIKVKGGSNGDFCSSAYASEYKRDFCQGGRTTDGSHSVTTSGDYVEYFKFIQTYNRSSSP